MANANVVSVLGDILEGGGQILRNSAALSCILTKPVEITKIRAKRSKPGLRAQHLNGFKLVGELCRAELVGAEMNSTEVRIHPSERIHGGDYHIDVGTAGSLVLILQASLPVALFADKPVSITAKGGTNADMAPPIDYFEKVFLPVAQRMGFNVHTDLQLRGFFPKGGGKVTVRLDPIKELNPISILDRGEVLSISGQAFVAGQLSTEEARKMAEEAKKYLERNMKVRAPINIEQIYIKPNQAVATGCGIFLSAETSTGCLFGGTGFGHKSKPAEKVAREAADELLRSLNQPNCCVGEHLQDQLIIFMSLAKGTSSVRTGPISLHTETAIHVAEKFTGVKFEVEDQADGCVIISCEGIGYTNKS